MNSRIKTWHKGLALTLPLIALLAGCNRGEKVEEPQTHALATYVSAPWEALPSVSFQAPATNTIESVAGVHAVALKM